MLQRCIFSDRAQLKPEHSAYFQTGATALIITGEGLAMYFRGEGRLRILVSQGVVSLHCCIRRKVCLHSASIISALKEVIQLQYISSGAACRISLKRAAYKLGCLSRKLRRYIPCCVEPFRQQASLPLCTLSSIGVPYLLVCPALTSGLQRFRLPSLTIFAPG